MSKENKNMTIPKFFKVGEFNPCEAFKELEQWLQEKNTYYMDNQGVHYNTIQVNEVIKKIKELKK